MRYAILSRLAEIKPRILKEEVSTRLTLTIMRQGWAGVTPADSDDALRFAELCGVRAMIETYPLEKAAEAYARMMSGNAEFRVVLTM